MITSPPTPPTAPVRDGLWASDFWNTPDGPIERIAHYCDLPAQGKAAQTCEAFNRIFSAQALKDTTGSTDVRELARRYVSNLSSETRKILKRYNALPADLQAQLPMDVQDLAKAAQQTLHHGKAKELEAFLNCRDNLIFWKKMNAVDTENRPIEFNELQTSDAYFQKYKSIEKTPLSDTSFDLSNSSLSSIPKDLFQWSFTSTLIELCLSGNHIASLPPEIGQLSNLVGLLLNNNQLTSLPSDICTFDSLESLGLAGNKLSNLPSGFGQLSRLNRLWLDSAHLDLFPRDLGSFQKLLCLNIDGKEFALASLQEFIQSHQLKVSSASYGASASAPNTAEKRPASEALDASASAHDTSRPKKRSRVDADSAIGTAPPRTSNR